jgi:hypothetical protein
MMTSAELRAARGAAAMLSYSSTSTSSFFKKNEDVGVDIFFVIIYAHGVGSARDFTA